MLVGEPALVYIDELGMTEPVVNHNNNYSSRMELQEPMGRKRKGTRMENVISKLSRRQLPKAEYECQDISEQGYVHSGDRQIGK